MSEEQVQDTAEESPPAAAAVGDAKEPAEEKPPKVEIKLPENPDSGPHVVAADTVKATIDSFTELDESGDRKAMNSLARRLGKEQPALLQAAASMRTADIEQVGEAAVFYSTLVWAVYERHLGRRAPRLLPANISDARALIEKEMEAVTDIGEKPVYERVSPDLHRRQPYLLTKIMELLEEDIREEAISADAAEAIMVPTQVVVEAFHGAVTGDRPGQNLDPVRREGPKVGRNDPCPCGSGNKFKKCCG